MRAALALTQTPGWYRVEIGTVPASRDEAHDLRERDVLLLESLPFRPDRAESGAALLVLSNGLQRRVELTLEEGAYVARIVGPSESKVVDGVIAINLVHRLVDAREFPDALDTTLQLNVRPSDQLVISLDNEVIAKGRIIDLDEQVGVRIEAREA